MPLFASVTNAANKAIILYIPDLLANALEFKFFTFESGTYDLSVNMIAEQSYSGSAAFQFLGTDPATSKR